MAAGTSPITADGMTATHTLWVALPTGVPSPESLLEGVQSFAATACR